MVVIFTISNKMLNFIVKMLINFTKLGKPYLTIALDIVPNIGDIVVAHINEDLPGAEWKVKSRKIHIMYGIVDSVEIDLKP